MLKIISINAPDLVLLLEEQELPIEYPLDKKYYFIFHHQNYLYGLYKVIQSNAKNKRHYLRKNHFKPFKLVGTQAFQKTLLQDPVKLLNILKVENQPLNELLITEVMLKEINQTKHTLLTLTSKLLPQQSMLLPPILNQSLDLVIDEIQSLTSQKDFSNTQQAKKEGKKLFELIFPNSIHSILPKINKVSVQTRKNIPLQTVFDSNHLFLGKTHFLPLSFDNLSNTSTKKARKNIVNSFQLLTTKEDDLLAKECEQISGVFKNKKQFKQRFNTLSINQNNLNAVKMQLEEMMADADFVHLAFHGIIHDDKFAISHQSQPILTTDDLTKLIRTPKAMMVTACHSLDHEFINWFFKHGGQSIIVSDGPLFSKNLPPLLRKFYWRLLYKKNSLLQSYQALIKELFFLNDINAFKLRLYGHGRERFKSF